MGRKRLFTREVYEQLEAGIATEPFCDFFADVALYVQDAFGDLELENNLDNIQNYLRDVSDLNDYTEAKLKEIFQNVEAVDKRYAGIFRAQTETLQAYHTVVKRLTEEIGNKNFVTDFDASVFFSSMAFESSFLLQMKWQELLDRPADEITEEEYMALASLVIRTGDAELLEDMLNLCYDYSDVEKNEAGGISVTVVSYTAGEKLEKFAEAVNAATVILQAGSMVGVGNIDNRTRESAIRINQLLQTFLPLGSSLDVATTENMQGDRKVTSERLIEISYNTEGELELKFFRYPGKNQVWIEQQPTIISISRAVTGESGERQAFDESFQYMSGYIGNSTVTGAVSKETVNQVLSTLIGKIPGSGVVSSVQSIITSGVNASNNPTEVCGEIADVGILADQFQLTYVSSDVNGEASSHTYSLYPSATTLDWVNAFNEYMQNGSGAEHAEACGFKELPGGEVTIGYLMTNPNEVSEMLDVLDKKLIDKSQTGDSKEEIIDIYQEIRNE